MTIKQALLHNTGWKILNLICTFVNNIIIVRLLGIVDSGDFFYTLAFFTLLSTLLRLGLENGVIYIGSKDEKKIGSLSIFILCMLALQWLACFIFFKYFFEIDTYYTTHYCTLFVVANIAVYYFNAFFQVKQMYKSLNILATIFALLQTLLLLLLYKDSNNLFEFKTYFKNNKNAILFILTFCLLLQIILQAIFYYIKTKSNFKQLSFNKTTYKQLFTYSSINYLGAIILFLIIRIDFYFVEKYCTPNELSNYIQVAKFGQMALIFPSLLGGVIFPYSVNANTEFEHKITFFCRLLTLLFVILFIVVLVAGNTIFTWLLGVEYYLIKLGLIITLLGVYSLAISTILISFFEGKNRQNIIIYSSIITLLILAVADIFIVPTYGFIGAAVVFSIANVIGCCILMATFLAQTNHKIKDVLFFTKNDTQIFTFWKML